MVHVLKKEKRLQSESFISMEIIMVLLFVLTLVCHICIECSFS